MAGPNWLIRCLPGVSIIAVAVLSECALEALRTLCLGFTLPTALLPPHNPIVAQVIFISYSLYLHVVALLFPLRLSWCVWKAASLIDKNHTAYSTVRSHRKIDQEHDRTQDEDTPVLRNDCDFVHSIVIPSYKEEIDVLEDTLKMLASHQMAAKHYDIFLAMEERDHNASSVATTLISSFRAQFRDMQFTTHPSGLDGEAAGKSSNISWAARQVSAKYAGRYIWEDVLLTVMDSDTHLLSPYFDIIQRRHLDNKTQEPNMMTLYMPPLIFDRNAHRVPTLVRVADLLWCGAGLSCFQSRPRRSGIGIPTAVYTVNLPLVALVEGWDTGPEAIGEDMHMMLKCYFYTNGKLNIESIPSPASHCNVSSSLSGFRGWIDGHKARYNQGLRHMWGCMDTGYTIHQWLNMGKALQESRIGDPVMSRRSEVRFSRTALQGNPRRRFIWRNMILFSRIFEAHFLPVHLFIVMLSSTIYSNLSAPLVHCEWLTNLLDFTGTLRACGFVAMLIYFAGCYERYHRICVKVRESELIRSGLYEEMHHSISKRSPQNPATWIDYLIFPVAGCIYGSLPLVHAAFSHFFTNQLTYKVSLKPKKILSQIIPRRIEEGQSTMNDA